MKPGGKKELEASEKLWTYSYGNNCLGVGAFGTVYQAWRLPGSNNKETPTPPGLWVAIKRMPEEKFKKGDGFEEYFQSEIKILGIMKKWLKEHTNPFILKVFECIQTTNNNTRYIVTEYCDSGRAVSDPKNSDKPKKISDLKDAIDIEHPKGMDPEMAFKIFYQIILGIL